MDFCCFYTFSFQLNHCISTFSEERFFLCYFSSHLTLTSESFKLKKRHNQNYSWRRLKCMRRKPPNRIQDVFKNKCIHTAPNISFQPFYNHTSMYSCTYFITFLHPNSNFPIRNIKKWLVSLDFCTVLYIWGLTNVINALISSSNVSFHITSFFCINIFIIKSYNPCYTFV